MKTFKQFLLEETEKKIVSATGTDGTGKTHVTYEDGSTATLTGPRPIRNNNPGNLVYSEFSRSQGAVGTDGRYAVFPTKQIGWNAKINLLKTRTYQSLSLRDAFNRYAPPSENPNYLRDLKQYTGFDLDRKMSSLNEEEFNTLINAVARIEGASDYINRYATTNTTTSNMPDYTDDGGASPEANASDEKEDMPLQKALDTLWGAWDTLKNYGKSL